MAMKRSRIIFTLILMITLMSLLVSSLLRQLEDNTNRSSSLHPRSSLPPFPGAKLEHVNWFMQISDIHVSRYYDKRRVSDFRTLITKYVNVIKPEVVLASGDLTDAKTKDAVGSTQFEDEWKVYNELLKQSNVTKRTVWLDIRGNHDAFDVPSLTADNNYYRIYSERGKSSDGSYRYEHVTKDKNRISFIGVDACPNPGPRRPFNFLGVLSQTKYEQLSQFAALSRGSNVTVWFGHYPTSTIVSPAPGLRHLLRQGAVYLCGHLHTFGSVVPRMYAMHRTGSLELELGDWKDNRMFRVFAVDHDLLSFTDEHFGKWPIVLITNPKDARFNIPLKEPTGKMERSTHIRILVFSPDPVTAVAVTVDSVFLGNAHHVQGPLYVLPWSAKDYKTGLHSISVHVQDSYGRERKVEQLFSLNNTKVAFDFLARLIIMPNHEYTMKMLFFVTLLLITFPLIALRCSNRRLYVDAPYLVCCSGPLKLWIRRLSLVAHHNAIFISLLCFNIYIATGPWFVGEMLDGKLGVCFVYGIYIDGTLLPVVVTYVYGFFQLLTFNLPLTLYLGYCLDRRAVSPRTERAPSIEGLLVVLWRFLRSHWFLLLLVTWQLYLSVTGYWRAYGAVAFFLGPVRTWSAILAVGLHHVAMRHDVISKPEANGHALNTRQRYEEGPISQRILSKNKSRQVRADHEGHTDKDQ